MGHVRSVWLAMAMLLALSGRVVAADFDVTVIPYEDDRVPRQAYLRRERPTVRVRIVNLRPQAVRGDGRLSLIEGDQVVRTLTFTFKAGANATAEVGVPLWLGECRAGEYRLLARCTTGGSAFAGLSSLFHHRAKSESGGTGGTGGTGEASAEAPIWVCSESDPDGLMMTIWWEHPAGDAPAIDAFLQRLRERGLTGVTVMAAGPTLLDRCLWNQVSCTTITHGDAAAAGFTGSPESLYRLNAANQPTPIPWLPSPGSLAVPGAIPGAGPGPGPDKIAGIANIDWQLAAARNLGTQVAALMKYPAFYPRIATDDDFYTRSGVDYSPWNIRRFRQMHGADAPRPPEMLNLPAPRTLAGPTGIISDTEPWVEWMRFLSRDVLGHYNRLLTGEVAAATNGKGRIAPISGPMFTPLADPASAQWPPYNFGDAGFNMIGSYNYNFYQAPALHQVWWQELGRMNNRDADAWLMLDSLDLRTAYHLQNWYLAMASGVDGLSYFIQEQTSDAAVEAFRRVGPIARRYGKLLARLRPAPRSVGLLMPFENACYDLDYPANAGYAFDNLVMAHVDAEPVWPEELPDVQSHYRAVLLHDVSRLTQGNLKLLADYQHRGGAVVCDATTGVAIPGSRKLDFALAGHDRSQSYDDPIQIAKVRHALEGLAPPWADSDDPHLLLRRFQADGIDYLWVVHLMDHEQDLAHAPKRPIEAIPPKVDPDADAGVDREQHEGVVSVPAGNYAVYDVLAGRRIDVQAQGGRLRIPVRMGKWQGTLLAFYPAAPDAMDIKSAHKLGGGRGIDMHVWITAGRHYAAGLLPLEVTVTDPDGQVSREYSHTALATHGQYKFALDFARNDQAGIWRVTVRELSTGLTQSVDIRVRAGL